jgi:hypothetical protein
MILLQAVATGAELDDPAVVQCRADRCEKGGEESAPRSATKSSV